MQHCFVLMSEMGQRPNRLLAAKVGGGGFRGDRVETTVTYSRNVAVHVFQVFQCDRRMKQQQYVNSCADNNLYC